MSAMEHLFRQQMVTTLTHLRAEGFEPPLYCAFIDRNGSTVCGRYEDQGRRRLTFTIVASHMAAQQVALPIQVMLVDRHGEAAHVALGHTVGSPLAVN